MRSEAFGRLLKVGIGSIATGEGKTQPIVEDELGQQIGLTGASIQRYKAGHLPPELRTIEILAEAAVKRGYLNREWLLAFLRAARHGAPDKLLDRLCPTGPARQSALRIYENLPAPTYNQFVMREQVFAEVVDGLQQRSAVVLIASLGGMGKTSLAREVAAHCLKNENDVPQFDAAIWVSDKDRPGTTTFSIVLDEIARTLDYPGFTQFEHEEKRREVEQLLRRQKVLLVVDNFETITDGALLSWLLRLPEPSKALITTREYSRAFRNNTYVVGLGGLTEVEAQKLISHRLLFLKIERLVTNHADLAPLVLASGGNPKAIEMAIGLIKYERRPLHQVVDDLYAARGELFNDLFSRAWKLLDEATQRVLLSATLFPDSVAAEALSATADVHGFTFDHAIERLIDLALLDEQRVNFVNSPRYLLHPLVRAFAGARLAEQVEFEEKARKRWIEWYLQLVAQMNVRWYVVTSLSLIDCEHENLSVLVDWVFQHHLYSEAIELGSSLGYYYYIRGLWNRNITINNKRIETARRGGDVLEEGKAIVAILRILTLQEKKTEASHFVKRLEQIMEEIQLSETNLLSFRHGIAMYLSLHGDAQQALRLMEQNLVEAPLISPFALNRTRSWLADHLYRQGDNARAKQLFQEALTDSVAIEYQRSITFCQTKLAEIAMDEMKLADASALLAASSALAFSSQDRRDTALIHRTYARLHLLRNEHVEARAALAKAADLYERLGMRSEHTEVRLAMLRLADESTSVENA